MNTNRITLEIKGVDEDQKGYSTVYALTEVFESCVNLAFSKSQDYGNAWQQQGWMGNFARIMSKVSRLKNMLWRDMPSGNAQEPVTDSVLDLVNLGAFMMVNLKRGNRWGDKA